LFNVIAGNSTFHDKSHWSRPNAKAALLTKSRCGYYYTLKRTAQYTHKSTGETASHLSPRQKKKKVWQKQWISQPMPVDVNDCARICVAAFNDHQNATYKKSDTHPNSRFLYFVDLPDGYHGKTAYQDNRADTDCTKVVIVITLGTNHQLATHFPCDDAYMNGMTDLV